jgi:hypothetical protein
MIHHKTYRLLSCNPIMTSLLKVQVFALLSLIVAACATSPSTQMQKTTTTYPKPKGEDVLLTMDDTPVHVE